MTRTIFSSSAIRSRLFCSRPAVSMSSMSLPSACGLARSASKASPAASAPVGRAITGAPVRSPQICSCSIAAARNVSPAASITLKPSRTAMAAELADGGGLARAVDADDQDHVRACSALEPQRTRDRRQHLRRPRRPARRRTSSGAISLSKRPCAERLGDARRRVDAEIGLDQQILELVERRLRRACAW